MPAAEQVGHPQVLEGLHGMMRADGAPALEAIVESFLSLDEERAVNGKVWLTVRSGPR